MRAHGQVVPLRLPDLAADGLEPLRELTPRVTLVPIAALRRTGSPRSNGLDTAHVRRLAEATGPLPPILVHRPTMQIIDGFHRVAVAIALLRDEIEAHLFDGPAESAFVLAVRANVSHGLPLSLTDRREAASRILDRHAQLSDRAIASSTGLSAKTVAGIRRARGGQAHVPSRMGRDGRLRPLSTATGRHLAAELLTARPTASLREIATATGVSPGTVRDVRLRLARGESPVPAGRRMSRPTTTSAERVDVTALVSTMSRDPALRMTEAGRELLRWLHLHAVDISDSAKLVEAAPEHCVGQLVEIANRCSANWAAVASELQTVHDNDLRTG